MKKSVKLPLIIVGSVLGGIVGLFLLLYLILAIVGCAAYSEARKAREYVCDVAGISDGIAPQGIAYSKEENIYIQTGYKSGNETLLYITENGSSRRVLLADESGKTLKGHAGGVACTKDCVYIAGGSKLYLFSLQELLNASCETVVSVKQSFYADNNSSFCYSNDDYLYVGEFYRAGNYETEQSHYYTTPSGEENKAIVSVYTLDENGLLAEEGVQPYPEYCISITGLVQGFAAENGVYMLSRSYGLKNSSLEYHTAPRESGTTMTVAFKGNKDAEARQVPLYYLDSATLFKTLTLPAFSEDLTVAGGRVVTTNEASANKYFIGKLFGSHKVYSYPVFQKD